MLVEGASRFPGIPTGRTRYVGEGHAPPGAVLSTCVGSRENRDDSRIVIARRRSRRGNLAVLGWIIGYSRRKRNCLPEIAASGGAAVDQCPSAVDFIPAVCYNLPILFWRW